jgi:type II secretory pathway component GspD/PulD (secretin)
VIGELTLKDNEEFGVNYLLHNRGGSLLTPGTASAVGVSGNNMTLNLAQLLTNPKSTRMLVGGAGGLTGFTTAGDSLSAIVTALKSTNKFKVTHRPNLFASNNKTATIISGERIAVITGSQSSPTGVGVGNSVINQVQYIDVNLKLQVIPLINSDKEVNLDILQTLAEITGSTPIKDSSGTVNDYPVISNRQLSTNVMVPNEGTLVLGGLVKDSRNKTKTGIPVLSKMPLLGGLFRSTSDVRERTELVILIRPSVSLGPEDIYEVRDRNMRPLRIPVNLEDELVLPDPVKTIKGRRSYEPDGKPALKPFRAEMDDVKPLSEPVRSSFSNPPAPKTQSQPFSEAAQSTSSTPSKKKSAKSPVQPPSEQQ